MINEHCTDDLARLEAAMSDEEREEVAAASAALDLARLVYAARKRRGLTQTEAAEQTGMKQQMISMLEGGTAQPTVKTVERYLRKLGFAIQFSLIDVIEDDEVDRVTLNEEGHQDSSRNNSGVALAENMV